LSAAPAIPAAARTALTASKDAPLSAIAKQAGVGHGTLYRHFPTREALLLTAYRYDVRELIDAAPVLLADHPPGCAASLARPARDRAAA